MTTKVMTAAPTSTGHDKCGATTKGTGRPCTRPAGWGTDHVGAGPCKLHLGCTQTHRIAARRTLANREGARELAEMGYEPVSNPIELLADLAGQANALVKFFGAKVDALGDDVRYQSEKGAEQLRAEMAIYERMLDRTGRLAGKLAELGFEERRTAIAEEDGRRLVDVLLAVVDGLFGVLAGKVKAAELERVRRDVLPGLVQRAIETTGTAA